MTGGEPGGVPRDSRGSVRAVPVTPRFALTLGLTTVLGVLAFAWPLLVDAGAMLDDATTAPMVLGVVLVAALLVLYVGLGDGGLDVKAIAVLGLLTAIGAVLRPLAAGTGGVETVFVLLVLGGRVFGPGFGFLLGTTTIFASALITGGVGPWLPYQMLAAGWVGLGAGLLPRRLRGACEIGALVAYGAVAAVVFGVAMNLSFWPFLLGGDTAVSFVPGAPLGENVDRFLLYTVATSLPWDLGRAATTAVGIAVVGRAVLLSLRRAARRAAFTPVGARLRSEDVHAAP